MIHEYFYLGQNECFKKKASWFKEKHEVNNDTWTWKKWVGDTWMTEIWEYKILIWTCL